jgi:pyruvate-ferredoxin/flavodoxin oxidoreductase
MQNGVDRSKAHPFAATKPAPRDALGALFLAEVSIAERVLFGLADVPRPPSHNAFGDAVAVEHDTDATALVTRAAERAAAGERVAVVADARALVAAKGALESIAQGRLALVVHALSSSDTGDVHALADLGFAVLFSSCVADSMDLTLIARRASEDSGTPFLVVHERARVRHTEPVVAPTPELCEAYLGATSQRMKKRADPGHPAHANVSERVFSERVPFALSSAMRELERLTGRRHDVLERLPTSDAQLMLVGLGGVGDSLLAEVERLRAGGHDVGAVRVVAYRPFPGPRLVKMLSRALAISVVEAVDVPLAQSNPLTREVKAAFADAITWAPDYPGVGRVPRIVSGVIGVGEHELESTELDAMVHNMLADERGKRLFVLGADESHALPPSPVARGGSSGFTMRGYVKDEATASACADLCSAVLASTLGVRVRAAVRSLAHTEGGGFAFDLVAVRERPRGTHAPHALKLIVLDDAAAMLRGNPLTRLASGGVLAVPTHARAAEAVWADVPPYAKAIVHDRGARVLGWEPPAGARPSDGPWQTAAVFAALALSAAAKASDERASFDPSLVGREVFDVLRIVLGPEREELAKGAGELARRAFEASVEVPRATVERDEDAVRLGRRDARGSVPPR